MPRKGLTLEREIDVDRDMEKFISLGGTVDEVKSMTCDSKPAYGIDPQYLFMGIWAFNKIREASPRLHVDIGGDVDFLIYLVQFVPVEHRDIRSCGMRSPDFRFVRDSITGLHLDNDSVQSLSCLHVAEHIGLGRYGDEIDPEGFHKACAELARVLAPGGNLYFAVPTGRERVVFNSHRVLSPDSIMRAFYGLELVDCAFINSSGAMQKIANLSDMAHDVYGCGLFEFTKRGT